MCDIKWRDTRPSMVTHTRNSCSAFNPSKVHTHSSEHTHGAVGSELCCGARGAVGGSMPCSRAPQSWYWGWRERCTFTPPTYNSCRTWDSNSQPLDYESDSLTIRPRFPQNRGHHPGMVGIRTLVSTVGGDNSTTELPGQTMPHCEIQLQLQETKLP